MLMTEMTPPSRERQATNMEGFQRLAGLFGVLADGTRLKILSLLSRGERDVSSLCRELSVAQPTVSHHLALLRASGILTTRRDGKWILYRLNPPAASSDGSEVVLEAEGCHVRLVCITAPAGDVAGGDRPTN